jgi:uncharacterized membrane protein
MKNQQVYISLISIIFLGAILRLWNLDLKALWLDEIITAMFSFGQNYSYIPLDTVFPLQQISEILTFQPGVSCSQIADNLANDSTHPPLFFCGMYKWLGLLNSFNINWVIKLRFLPVLFGIISILAMYFLNKIAFSPSSGIMAALLMSLSPFAVYLSQEARHYTLPMLLIIISLFLLIKIQQDIIYRQSYQFSLWLLWAVINVISLYVHYFVILSLNAQFITLLLNIYRHRSKITNLRKIWSFLILSIIITLISFTPWLLVIFSHLRSSTTNWLPSPQHIEPIYQTLLHWVLMMITLPVENQTLIIQIFSIFLMVMFTVFTGWKVFKNIKYLWFNHENDLEIFTLLSFTILIILQFFMIAYFLGKDITVVPRYSFVYYPGFCALLAVSLEKSKIYKYIFLTVGIISCIFVVNNLTFQKPFFPDQVAQNINLEPNKPLMLVIKYDNYQDVAAGLSFAVALEEERSKNQASKINQDSLAFLNNSFDLSNLNQKLAQFSTPNTSEFNFWFIGSSIERKHFPSQFQLTEKTTCNIDTNHHYRIGRFPYQGYRCMKVNGDW